VTLNGVRNIKIMKGRGEKADYLDEAKTVWLASNERQAPRKLLPFGWLLVEPYRRDGELTSWPVQAADNDTRQWRAGLRTRQKSLIAKLQADQREERARQQAKEEIQREAEEREARRAAMSEEARKLDDLRAMLARDRDANRREKGGELVFALNNLLKEAAKHWQGSACAELANLADEISGFVGWPAKRKKQQRKELIETVRGKAS
jgi:CRISPR-associated protein Csm5